MLKIGEQEFLTIWEVAKEANVCAETVRRWIRGDKLKAIKVGAAWLIARDNLTGVSTNAK